MKNKFIVDIPTPTWRKITACINIFVLMFYACFPGSLAAYTLISNDFIEAEVNNSPQYVVSDSSDELFEKSYYVEDSTSQNSTNISDFYQRLLSNRKSSLPDPLMIPIINGDITIIIPHYPLEKRIGDDFVQSRLIRSQIFNLINRQLLSDQFNNEAEQINDLYNNAYEFSGQSTKRFGEQLTRDDVTTFDDDFIWPELRTINNEPILVPVVHLTDRTIDLLTVDGNTLNFNSDTVELNNININGGTVHARRSTFFNVAGDLNLQEGAKLKSDKDLNLLVGGTLQNISGQLEAQDNINIIAGQYIQKTMVHRFATPNSQGSRLGEIASVNAISGDISIESLSDIVIEGGTVSGNNITFQADGNIILSSQETSYSSNNTTNGWNESESAITQLSSQLTAQESIQLIASGAIEINGSTLHAETGTISLLAGQGIYILNAENQFQSARSGKFGSTTIQEQEFQSIAVRSALNAGQGIVIATEFGDVNLRATELTSTTGTNISANNGAVNFLMTKEQETYFYNKVKEGFWRIKTTTIEDNVETAVYNQIIGGVQVQATNGLTIELAQYENGSTQENGQDTESARISQEIQDLKEDIADAERYGQNTDALNAQLAQLSDDLLQEQLSSLAQNDSSLAWMQEAYNNPVYSNDFNIVYQKLVEIHKFDKSSTLSPAAMAIIAIAVAVALGPAGAGVLGSGGTLFGTTLNVYAQAAIGSIANQAAMSIANGENIENTARALFESENIRATATAVITAGVMQQLGDSFEFFDAGDSAADYADLTSAQQTNFIINQTTQAIGNSVVRTGISTVVNGGNLRDFYDSFQSTLLQSAVNEIGKTLATEIGDSASSGDIGRTIRYLSHAAVGCVTGSLTAEINNTNAGLGCSSGAGGAVVGELIADTHRHFNNADELEAGIQEADKNIRSLLGIGDESDFSNLTNEQTKILEDNYFALQNIDVAKQRLLDLKATGVDLAKLGAGLAAFAAGGNVNIAAAAGENAAENNAWWWVVQGAYLLWKAYDLAQTIEGVYDAGVELNRIKNDDSLSEAEKQFLREELIKSIGYSILGDVVIGKSANEVLGKLKDVLNDSSLGKEIKKQLEQFTESVENNTQLSLAGNDRADISLTQNNSSSGLSNERIVIQGRDTGLQKTTFPKDQYTEEEFRLLKHHDGEFSPHTVERHGPHVTKEHLIERAKTGVTPDGIPSNFIPGVSSRFTDKNALLESAQTVKPGSAIHTQKLANATDRELMNGSMTVVVNIGKPIGNGFQTNTSKGLGKSVPLDTQTGKPQKGITFVGEPVPINNLTHVSVNYQLDTSTNTWYINTLYPSRAPN